MGKHFFNRINFIVYYVHIIYPSEINKVFLCLISDDEGGNIKPIGLSENRKSNQNDLYMRLGLLLGDSSRGKKQKHKASSRDSCTSLASIDAHTVVSNNTSPVRF